MTEDYLCAKYIDYGRREDNFFDEWRGKDPTTQQQSYP